MPIIHQTLGTTQKKASQVKVRKITVMKVNPFPGKYKLLNECEEAKRVLMIEICN